MKPNQVAEILKVCIINGWNVLLKGSPGTAKTSIIEQVTKELGYDIVTEVSSLSMPVDYKGLPGIVNGEAQFLPYGFQKKLLTADKPLVCFFDDIGWATPSVINSLASLILNREINGQKISPHVRFVAATNEKKDNSNVNSLSLAFLSRFHTSIRMEVCADSWINWAIENDLETTLISYIKAKPSMLSTFIGQKDETFACPRTIKFLSDMIKAGIINHEAWSGTVGEAFSVEFMAYYKICKSIATLPAEIVKNPATAEIPSKPDVLYFVLAALPNRTKTEEVFCSALEYFARLPKEYEAFAVKLIATKNPKMKETSCFINWHVKNQDVVV